MRLIKNLLGHTRKVGNCLLWVGGKRNGYGRLRRRGKSFSVHVRVFEEYNRKLLPGEVVRHSCNRTLCINPDHLLAGSQRDNVWDAVKSRTHQNPRHPGEKHPLAKLRLVQVAKIKKLATLGFSHTEIAKQFPVKRRQISRILQGTRWAT